MYNVLIAHNHYRHAGGEDQVFFDEGRLLEENGHRVIRYTKHNDRIANYGAIGLARRSIWNSEVVREVRKLIQQNDIDIVHVHNTWPLISPAIYYAAKAEGVPTVQTLHNYRLLCPAELLLRDGAPCEDCVHKRIKWPGVLHACYLNSRPATAVPATMVAWHRFAGTWSSKVDAYIALTEFGRGKYIEGGLPPEKLHVKPNFVYADPGVGSHAGNYALFVGRLSHEKGVDVLLDAWNKLNKPLPLRIVGDGPLVETTREAGKRNGLVDVVGRRDHDAVLELMKDATLLIMPSRSYESFGLSIIEAFATGLPVIASRMGSMASLVEDGITGLLFTPIDAADLASKVEWALDHPEAMVVMGRHARRAYEEHFTAKRNYQLLMEIYRSVIEGKAQTVGHLGSSKGFMRGTTE